MAETTTDPLADVIQRARFHREIAGGWVPPSAVADAVRAAGYKSPGEVKEILDAEKMDRAVMALGLELHPDVWKDFKRRYDNLRASLLGTQPGRAAMAETLSDYLLGWWAENVVHADPCDCDLDDEELGRTCAEASGAKPALLRNEGGFAPSLLMYLPPLADPGDEGYWVPVWVRHPVGHVAGHDVNCPCDRAECFMAFNRNKPHGPVASDG